MDNKSGVTMKLLFSIFGYFDPHLLDDAVSAVGHSTLFSFWRKTEQLSQNEPGS